MAANRLAVADVKGIGVPREEQVELTKQIRQQLAQTGGIVADKRTLSMMTPLCLQRVACRQRLHTLYGVTHFFETSVNGLGSTFSVTLKLHDLRAASIAPLKIQEPGKRSTTTFSEVAKRAVNRLIEVAQLTPPQKVLIVEHPVVPIEVAVAPVTAITPAAFAATRAVETAKPQEQRWFKKWWVWTLVSSAVIGATTVAVIGLSGDDNSTAAGGTNPPPGGNPPTNPPPGGGGGSTLTTTILLR